MCTRPIPESFARRSGPIASIIFIILLLVWVMVSSLISSVQNRPHSSSAPLAAAAAGKSPWPEKKNLFYTCNSSSFDSDADLDPDAEPYGSGSATLIYQYGTQCFFLFYKCLHITYRQQALKHNDSVADRRLFDSWIRIRDPE
jgi:hypothetical protein